MPVVRVEPEAIVLTVEPGETLIEAAWRLGYVWPTTCYGQAECTACHVEIITGEEHASAVGDDEAAALTLLGKSGRRWRLACRLKLAGDAVVRKRGVRVQS
ncbi:MAG TPA: 2Fe-2S iron-sulfur cluster-binding protein [Acidimicrobiales bacterium]|nr:2Fe-2S iron-sulfur cluster-binding protein [Acidimicrobiales bacterium]